MKVRIVRGYGEEKVSDSEQEKFLNYFKTLLEDCGLSIISMASDRSTGGPVTLTVPDNLDPDEITKAFLTLATALAQKASREEGEEIEIGFDLMFPFCPVPFNILGTGY